MNAARKPPPNLQDLVAKSGGYNRITPEAWAEWDQQNDECQAKYRRALAEETQAGRSPLKRKKAS
jgi:hypothetical protein